MDLSHLSEKERESILHVLKRDEELRKKDEQKLHHLKNELHFLRKRGALKEDLDPETTCSRCRVELGRLLNRGAICSSCQAKVCKSCRAYSQSGDSWICVVCHKQMEIQAASGEWMNEFVRRPSKRRDNKVFIPPADLVKHSIKRSWASADGFRRNIDTSGAVKERPRQAGVSNVVRNLSKPNEQVPFHSRDVGSRRGMMEQSSRTISQQTSPRMASAIIHVPQPSITAPSRPTRKSIEKTIETVNIDSSASRCNPPQPATRSSKTLPTPTPRTDLELKPGGSSPNPSPRQRSPVLKHVSPNENERHLSGESQDSGYITTPQHVPISSIVLKNTDMFDSGFDNQGSPRTSKSSGLSRQSSGVSSRRNDWPDPGVESGSGSEGSDTEFSNEVVFRKVMVRKKREKDKKLLSLSDAVNPASHSVTQALPMCWGHISGAHSLPRTKSRTIHSLSMPLYQTSLDTDACACLSFPSNHPFLILGGSLTLPRSGQLDKFLTMPTNLWDGSLDAGTHRKTPTGSPVVKRIRRSQRESSERGGRLRSPERVFLKDEADTWQLKSDFEDIHAATLEFEEDVIQSTRSRDMLGITADKCITESDDYKLVFISSSSSKSSGLNSLDGSVAGTSSANSSPRVSILDESEVLLFIDEKSDWDDSSVMLATQELDASNEHTLRISIDESVSHHDGATVVNVLPSQTISTASYQEIVESFSPTHSVDEIETTDHILGNVVSSNLLISCHGSEETQELPIIKGSQHLNRYFVRSDSTRSSGERSVEEVSVSHCLSSNNELGKENFNIDDALGEIGRKSTPISLRLTGWTDEDLNDPQLIYVHKDNTEEPVMCPVGETVNIVGETSIMGVEVHSDGWSYCINTNNNSSGVDLVETQSVHCTVDDDIISLGTFSEGGQSCQLTPDVDSEITSQPFNDVYIQNENLENNEQVDSRNEDNEVTQEQSEVTHIDVTSEEISETIYTNPQSNEDIKPVLDTEHLSVGGKTTEESEESEEEEIENNTQIEEHLDEEEEIVKTALKEEVEETHKDTYECENECQLPDRNFEDNLEETFSHETSDMNKNLENTNADKTDAGETVISHNPEEIDNEYKQEIKSATVKDDSLGSSEDINEEKQAVVEEEEEKIMEEITVTLDEVTDIINNDEVDDKSNESIENIAAIIADKVLCEALTEYITNCSHTKDLVNAVVREEVLNEVNVEEGSSSNIKLHLDESLDDDEKESQTSLNSAASLSELQPTSNANSLQDLIAKSTVPTSTQEESDACKSSALENYFVHSFGGRKNETMEDEENSLETETLSEALSEGTLDQWESETDKLDESVEDSDTTFSDSVSSDEANFDGEEELRGFSRTIDLSLHTIIEESCEESDNGERARQKAKTPIQVDDETDLEKYFSFTIGNTLLSLNSKRRSLAEESEASEASDSYSETSGSICSEGLDKMDEDVDSAELASSRLEKYFMTGFLGLENCTPFEDHQESEGEIDVVKICKRKVSGRSKGMIRTDSVGSEMSSTSQAEDANSDHSSSTLSDDGVAPFDKTEGFDTIKRKKKGLSIAETKDCDAGKDTTDKSLSKLEASSHFVTPLPDSIVVGGAIGLDRKQQSRDSGFIGSSDDLLKDATEALNEKEFSLEKMDETMSQLEMDSEGMRKKSVHEGSNSDDETRYIVGQLMDQITRGLAVKIHGSPLLPRAKPPELEMFEAELSKLMKIVPGIDATVKEIVEELSSTDYYSDSYESSDYNSSEHEGPSRLSLLRKSLRSSLRSNDDLRHHWSKDAATPLEGMGSNEGEGPTVEDSLREDANSPFTRETIYIYEKLMTSLGRMAEQAGSDTEQHQGNQSPASTRSQRSTTIQAVQHIRDRLTFLMREVQASSESSMSARVKRNNSSSSSSSWMGPRVEPKPVFQSNDATGRAYVGNLHADITRWLSKQPFHSGDEQSVCSTTSTNYESEDSPTDTELSVESDDVSSPALNKRTKELKNMVKLERSDSLSLKTPVPLFATHQISEEAKTAKSDCLLNDDSDLKAMPNSDILNLQYFITQGANNEFEWQSIVPDEVKNEGLANYKEREGEVRPIRARHLLGSMKSSSSDTLQCISEEDLDSKPSSTRTSMLGSSTNICSSQSSLVLRGSCEALGSTPERSAQSPCGESPDTSKGAPVVLRKTFGFVAVDIPFKDIESTEPDRPQEYRSSFHTQVLESGEIALAKDKVDFRSSMHLWMESQMKPAARAMSADPLPQDCIFLNPLVPKANVALKDSLVRPKNSAFNLSDNQLDRCSGQSSAVQYSTITKSGPIGTLLHEPPTHSLKALTLPRSGCDLSANVSFLHKNSPENFLTNTPTSIAAHQDSIKAGGESINRREVRSWTGCLRTKVDDDCGKSEKLEILHVSKNGARRTPVVVNSNDIPMEEIKDINVKSEMDKSSDAGSVFDADSQAEDSGASTDSRSVPKHTKTAKSSSVAIPQISVTPEVGAPSIQSNPSGRSSLCSQNTSDKESVPDEDIDRLVALHKTRSSLSSLGNRSDSMTSVYSAAGGGRYGTVVVRGEVLFGLKYNFKMGALEVHIKKCRDLAPVDVKRNRSDPYVKIYLLPDKSKSGKRKTKVKKHTLNPTFDEVLRFFITISELETRTLWLTVWHSDMFGRNDFLGEVMLPLGYDVPNDDASPKWYLLQERLGPPEEVMTYKGELIMALKYVPPDVTTQKKGKQGKGALHVLVKEARNLTAVRSNGTSDPFCKCYLLPDKSKNKKQKTQVVKKNCNPKWNHTFVYSDVDLDELRERCLELTVWDYDRLTSNDFLGGCRLSLGTGRYQGKEVDWMDSRGDEIALWQNILDKPNVWVDGYILLQPTMEKRPSDLSDL